MYNVQKLVLVEGIHAINEHLAKGYVHFGYPFAINNCVNLAMSSPSVPAPIQPISAPTPTIKDKKNAKSKLDV